MLDQIKTNYCNNYIVKDFDSRGHYRLGDMVLLYDPKSFLPGANFNFFISDEELDSRNFLIVAKAIYGFIALAPKERSVA